MLAFAHPFVAAWWWLAIHLLLLGAATNAILVWSAHFTAAVLRVPLSPHRHGAALRLMLLNAGVVAVLMGGAADRPWLGVAGAVMVFGAVGAHLWWLAARLRKALPARFAVTVRYYLAAAVALLSGIPAGAWMLVADGGVRQRVLLFHAHVNLLGWIMLTVLGTVLTLWPTVLRTRMDPQASAAARRTLPVAVVGLALTAVGVLAWWPVVTIWCWQRGRRPAWWGRAAPYGWMRGSSAGRSRAGARCPATGRPAWCSPSPPPARTRTTWRRRHPHRGRMRRGRPSTRWPIRVPGAGFRARDATAPTTPAGRLHKIDLQVRETQLDVAPGVRQTMWAYNGTVPGPTLRGRIGDTFEVTLTNDGTVDHGVDFHAGSLAPDAPMRPIEPGQSLTYRFTATKAGIWMYHCSTMPMPLHIGNGMYGAVIIDPPGLTPVDREYVLVQSELYLGGDLAAMQAEKPDAVMFNGYAAQYAHRPLPARTGERVRFWVLDAGPDRSTSFHVVGAQFDTVYAEGRYQLRRSDAGGAQVLTLGPAGGGFVETVFPEAGHYPFVDHAWAHADRGARGVVAVTRD